MRRVRGVRYVRRARHAQVELKPGGASTPVSRANRLEFVIRVVDYRLNAQARCQRTQRTRRA